MPSGRHNSGPLWVDGSIALRIRDKKHRSWRMVKLRRPHAVIGSDPHADLVIDRPDVAGHHVFLFLDARGLFGVDLRTDRGTRFAGSEVEAAWLGSGDLVEAGDHQIEVIQLRVDGAVLSGPLSDDNPLGPADGGRNTQHDLTLRLLDGSNSNWSIGSSLVFLGRGPACAVTLADEAVAATHAAILRAGSRVYLIPFPGAVAAVNDRIIAGAVELADADVVRVGRDSLLIQTHELVPRGEPAPLDRLADRLGAAVGIDAITEVGFSFDTYRTISDPSAGPIDYPSLIGRLQAETAALVAVLLRRIEALDDEMAALRDRLDDVDRVRAVATPPIEKLRWDLIPPPPTEAAPPSQSGAWLVDRLRDLEAQRQTAWSNLLGRIGPVHPAD